MSTSKLARSTGSLSWRDCGARRELLSSLLRPVGVGKSCIDRLTSTTWTNPTIMKHRGASKGAPNASPMTVKLITIATVFIITIASQQLIPIQANAANPASTPSKQQQHQQQQHQQLMQDQQQLQNSAIIATATDQIIRQAFPHQPLSDLGLGFDSSKFKSIYEAIRAHPDLSEFANLCESKGVKEIVSMDEIALTVFAPIDKSLGDLLAKSKGRSINLIDLAKHHIAHGFITPNDNMKYPHQFQSYAGLSSPLYLNMVASGGHSSGVYVNNAKIVATYLIQIDQDNYQTLHLIDEPLEFAYVNRRAQLRQASQQQAAGGSASGQHQQLNQGRHLLNSAGSSSSAMALVASSSGKQFASVKRPLQLDDLVNPHSDELNEQTKAAILEFSERFGDLLASQPQVDLYKARSLSSSSTSSPINWSRLNLLFAREQLQFDRLTRLISATDLGPDLLRGKLYNVNESNSLNTYFLPVNGDELQQLLEGGTANLQNIDLALQAHIIPDQVLFTRTMSLGQLHPTLLNRAPSSQTGVSQQQVSLGLVKAVPSNMKLYLANGEQSGSVSERDEQSRRLMASPLLLQAKCEPGSAADVPTTESQDAPQQQQGFRFRNGLTQAEILLANIPISNGVLHLIKKPILVQSTNLLDFINDNEHQLTNFVQALGSQSGPYKLTNIVANESQRPKMIELNKFRELLARDRQMLATFSNDFLHSNRTLLAPSDEAFAKLRYDLRALIFNDELMIPNHWDPSYRQDLLKRLIERHIVPDLTITSDVILRRQPGVQQQSVSSQNGQLLSFKLPQSGRGSAGDSTTIDQTIEVDCGSSSARLVHQDLIGTNGVLHVVDQVLGEEQETVHSLLTSLVVSYSARLQLEQSASSSPPQSASPMEELRELIEQNLRQIASTTTSSSESSNSLQESQPISQDHHQSSSSQNDNQLRKQALVSPELDTISKTIGQYLDSLSPARRQLLASSVNISFHLAKLVSRAEGGDDWNEKFQRTERAFTYFVPNDLAWLTLQQRQPELYKPLVYFLGQQQQQQQQQATIGASQQQAAEQQQALVVAGQQQANAPPTSGPVPRSSESSHRLLQILERHLIGNKRLDTMELNQLGSLHTLGATLRLVDSQQNQLMPADGTLTTSGQTGSGSAFAALHSIISGVSGSHSSPNEQQLMTLNGQAAIKRALEFGSTQANILQAYETSNGFVYLIDSVLILPEDSDYIVQTSSTPAISSTMSSLLGGHNSAILDLMQSIFSSTTSQMSTNSIIALIATLTIAIVALTLVALVLIVRRYHNKSLNRHQQLESGLTSSSSANSGSTSTTKSL